MITAEDLYTEDDFDGNDMEINEENPPGENAEEPPHSENEDNEGEGSANKQPVKPKRIIRNPQPKLNAETLKGKRGLTALESYFERVKYKGRGHEEEDLSVILKTYEYWCHRLFPKYPFDACLAKIEHLGSKRPVVTHIKKIRANLLVEDDPIIPPDDNDSVTEELQLDNFDNLFDVNDQPQQPHVEIDEEQLERIRLNKERAERIRKEKVVQRMELLAPQTLNESQNLTAATSVNDSASNIDIPELSDTQSSIEISEDQLERIRQNKERAERIRREKLKKRMELTASQEQPQNSQPSTSANDDTQNLFQQTYGTELETLSESANPSNLHEISEQENNHIINKVNDELISPVPSDVNFEVNL